MHPSFFKLVGKLTLLFFLINGGPIQHTIAQEEIVDHQLWFDVIPNFGIGYRCQPFGFFSNNYNLKEKVFE